MIEELKYPQMDAAASIFKKLGIDPSTRFDEFDQDFEYTSCKLEELESYLSLYEKGSTSDLEKRVLGCFFLECLNEYIHNNNQTHEFHQKIIEILENDISIHKSELEYWASSESENQEDWWPISEYILKWKNT